MVTGQDPSATPALLAGYAAQAAAALDRERLRTQAAQAEALAEGNRMRTALLAAVSHDLRTPLASIKAARQQPARRPTCSGPRADEADLLATIEENADRLDALIGNLLDMSRLHTGSLQPFLRPTAIDEVAPLAARRARRPLRLRARRCRTASRWCWPTPACSSGCWPTWSPTRCATRPPGRPPRAARGPDGGTVRLEVVDHGPGRARTSRERIFEPFQRLGDRPPAPASGSGSRSRADSPRRWAARSARRARPAAG